MKKTEIKKQINAYSVIFNYIEELYACYAEENDLSYNEYLVLEAIYYAEGISLQKCICAQTRLPKQNVNVAVRKFWELGYVDLREIPRDRRNKEICLTESGREYADRYFKKLEQIENFVAEGISDGQGGELLKYAQTIKKRYEKAFSEYASAERTDIRK